MSRPNCYAVFRSGQHDAEADCFICVYDHKCMFHFAFKAGLEQAAKIAEAEGRSQWGNFTVVGVEPTTATNNIIGANAPLFYGRAQGCEIAAAAIRAEKEKTND